MDLTARQRELAASALRIVAREGMSAVTFRSVAAESGWSVGAVQKAFATKDDLVAAMFDELRAQAAAGPVTEPGRPTLQAWLLELFLVIMPLDAERRDRQLHGAAFAERAAYDQRVGRVIADSDQEILGLLASLVRRAQGEGEVSEDVDADAVAWAFLALAQGAATQLLYDPMSAQAVTDRARIAIAALLRG